MPRRPINQFNFNEIKKLQDDEVENSYLISQEQLQTAKIFSSREEYTKFLEKNIRYLEIGVAWGYYSEIVCKNAEPKSIHLIDKFNQDLKCWTQRQFGVCNCTPKHTLEYGIEDHELYIRNKFSKYNNLKVIKGDCLDILKNLEDEYDYIYIDITNDRNDTRMSLRYASKLVPVGGIIGLNDYLIYDGINEDILYGTFQTVNEFLFYNKNWNVDALALHPLGFFDIYIRKSYDI